MNDDYNSMSVTPKISNKSKNGTLLGAFETILNKTKFDSMMKMVMVSILLARMDGQLLLPIQMKMVIALVKMDMFMTQIIVNSTKTLVNELLLRLIIKSQNISLDGWLVAGLSDTR